MERFSSLEVAIDGVEWLCSKGYIYLVLRDRGNTFLKELWVRILRDESFSMELGGCVVWCVETHTAMMLISTHVLNKSIHLWLI